MKQCLALFQPARARRVGLGTLLASLAVAGCGSGTEAQRVFAEAGGRMVEAKAGEVRPCIEVDPGSGCGGFEAAATETVPLRAGGTLSVRSGHPPAIGGIRLTPADDRADNASRGTAGAHSVATRRATRGSRGA